MNTSIARNSPLRLLLQRHHDDLQFAAAAGIKAGGASAYLTMLGSAMIFALVASAVTGALCPAAGWRSETTQVDRDAPTGDADALALGPYFTF